jgi:hypothetical protein
MIYKTSRLKPASLVSLGSFLAAKILDRGYFCLKNLCYSGKIEPEKWQIDCNAEEKSSPHRKVPRFMCFLPLHFHLSVTKRIPRMIDRIEACACQGANRNRVGKFLFLYYIIYRIVKAKPGKRQFLKFSHAWLCFLF